MQVYLIWLPFINLQTNENQTYLSDFQKSNLLSILIQNNNKDTNQSFASTFCPAIADSISETTKKRLPL